MKKLDIDFEECATDEERLALLFANRLNELEARIKTLETPAFVPATDCERLCIDLLVTLKQLDALAYRVNWLVGKVEKIEERL